MRPRALLATVALLAAACGQTNTAVPGAIPTAARLASVPEPTIVTVAGATPSGGATAEQIYTVVAGDVLGTIADRFNVPSAQIRARNNLSGDNIQIGQRLRIPARTGSVLPTVTPFAGVTSYTVVAGDTALGIALQFDTTVEALERANGVAKGGLERLQLGQVVKLPPPGQR